jgi:hypothetical protein
MADTVRIMMIFNSAIPIRQSKGHWAEFDGEPTRQPLGKKVDAALAAVSNIGPYVQKIVRSNGAEQPCGNSAAEARSHPAHGERDGADKSATLKQIELERNITLQRPGIYLEVNHQYTMPACDKQRLTKPRQHPLACGLAWLASKANDRAS